jgi:cobaltochelatase CobN
MMRIGIVSLLLLTLSPRSTANTVQEPTPAQDRIQLSYVYSDGNLPSTIQAYKALLDERPDLNGRVSLNFLTESFFNDVTAEELTGSDVLVLDIMNQQMLDRFNEARSVDVIERVTERGHVLAVGAGLMPQESYADLGVTWDERARSYWASGGFSNQVGLMKQALAYAGVSGLVLPDPQPALNFGYYYPDGTNGLVFSTWDEFDAWRTANGKRRPGAPRVAVGFYRANFYGGDTALLNAVIAEIERQGAEAIPLFGYPGHVSYDRLLTDEHGDARADVSLSFLFRFSGFEAGAYLETLDIPVISLIALYGRTE